MNNRNEPFLDLLALLVAVIATAVVSVSAAWWYDIAWRDITSSGASGLFVYVFMFALFAGMPAYFAVRYLRARHRLAALQGR